MPNPQQNPNIAILTLTPTGTIKEATTAARQLLGYEITGLQITDIITGPIKNQQIATATTLNGDELQIDLRVTTDDDGHRTLILWDVTSIKDLYRRSTGTDMQRQEQESKTRVVFLMIAAVLFVISLATILTWGARLSGAQFEQIAILTLSQVGTIGGAFMAYKAGEKT